MRAGRTLALVAGAAVLTAAPALAATRGPTKHVAVHDNYYGPSKVTINPGTTVKWTWADDATDVHDVKLKTAPRGVRKFASDPLAIGDTFARKLTRSGTYRIICTFHEEEMRMTIVVRKKR